MQADTDLQREPENRMAALTAATTAEASEIDTMLVDVPGGKLRAPVSDRESGSPMRGQDIEAQHSQEEAEVESEAETAKESQQGTAEAITAKAADFSIAEDRGVDTSSCNTSAGGSASAHTEQDANDAKANPSSVTTEQLYEQPGTWKRAFNPPAAHVQSKAPSYPNAIQQEQQAEEPPPPPPPADIEAADIAPVAAPSSANVRADRLAAAPRPAVGPASSTEDAEAAASSGEQAPTTLKSVRLRLTDPRRCINGMPWDADEAEILENVIREYQHDYMREQLRLLDSGAEVLAK